MEEATIPNVRYGLFIKLSDWMTSRRWSHWLTNIRPFDIGRCDSFATTSASQTGVLRWARSKALGIHRLDRELRGDC